MGLSPVYYEAIMFLTDKILTIVGALRKVAKMDEEKVKAAIPQLRTKINELIDIVNKL